MTVYEKIDAQCKGKEYTMIPCLGDHLKTILRLDPSLEEIVDKDLDVPAMSLEACEKKIKAWADDIHKTKKIQTVGVPMEVADKIVREFYGLPDVSTLDLFKSLLETQLQDTEDTDNLDFADFLGD